MPINMDQAAKFGLFGVPFYGCMHPPGVQNMETFWVKVQSFAANQPNGVILPLSSSKLPFRVYDKSRTCHFMTDPRTSAHATVAAMMERSAVVGHLGGSKMYFLAQIKTKGKLNIFVNQNATTMPW